MKRDRDDKTKQQDELIVDFVGGAVGHRFRSSEGRGQALAKAAGLVLRSRETFLKYQYMLVFEKPRP